MFEVVFDVMRYDNRTDWEQCLCFVWQAMLTNFVGSEMAVFPRKRNWNWRTIVFLGTETNTAGDVTFHKKNTWNKQRGFFPQPQMKKIYVEFPESTMDVLNRFKSTKAKYFSLFVKLKYKRIDMFLFNLSDTKIN